MSDIVLQFLDMFQPLILGLVWFIKWFFCPVSPSDPPMGEFFGRRSFLGTPALLVIWSPHLSSAQGGGGVFTIDSIKFTHFNSRCIAALRALWRSIERSGLIKFQSCKWNYCSNISSPHLLLQTRTSHPWWWGWWGCGGWWGWGWRGWRGWRGWGWQWWRVRSER